MSTARSIVLMLLVSLLPATGALAGGGSRQWNGYARADAGGVTRATVTQVAFYGIAQYVADRAPYDAGVFINTPLTSDSSGNVYFGFYVTGSTPAGLQSGVARISATGVGTWVSAA